MGDRWAIDDVFDIAERQRRFSKFLRHFQDFPLNKLKDLGESLSIAHGLADMNQGMRQSAVLNKVSIDRLLWREGIAAEESNPLQHPSVEAFQAIVRHRLADWADFDMACAHHSYGYDFLCTEDKGHLRSNSIFGAAYSSDLETLFELKTATSIELAKLCWKRFRFPVVTWRS